KTRMEDLNDPNNGHLNVFSFQGSPRPDPLRGRRAATEPPEAKPRPRATKGGASDAKASIWSGRIVCGVGWGARIRTWECRYQKPMPYHLATPQLARFLHGLQKRCNNRSTMHEKVVGT